MALALKSKLYHSYQKKSRGSLTPRDYLIRQILCSKTSNFRQKTLDNLLIFKIFSKI